MIIVLEPGETLEVRFADSRDQNDDPSIADGKLVVTYTGNEIRVSASEPDSEGRWETIYHERGAAAFPDQDGDEHAAIIARMKKIIVDHLGCPSENVTASASFYDDLGADSLDTVELIMAFESEWSIELPDEDADSVITVLDAAAVISRHLESR